jgi:hypothetical protein
MASSFSDWAAALLSRISLMIVEVARIFAPFLQFGVWRDSGKSGLILDNLSPYLEQSPPIAAPAKVRLNVGS